MMDGNIRRQIKLLLLQQQLTQKKVGGIHPVIGAQAVQMTGEMILTTIQVVGAKNENPKQK
jgi:hypothetical protein